MKMLIERIKKVRVKRKRKEGRRGDKTGSVKGKRGRWRGH